MLTQKEFASMGGIARAKKLSGKKLSQIARKAARARWAMKRTRKKPKGRKADGR